MNKIRIISPANTDRREPRETRASPQSTRELPEDPYLGALVNPLPDSCYEGYGFTTDDIALFYQSYPLLRFFRRFLWFLENHLVIAWLAKEHNYDLVFGLGTWGPSLILLKKVLRFHGDVACMFFGAQGKQSGNFVTYLRDACSGWLLSYAKLIIFISIQHYREYKERYEKAGVQVYYIPKGVDTEFFDPEKATVDDCPDISLQGTRYLLVVGDVLRDDHFLWRALSDRRTPIVRVTRFVEVKESVEKEIRQCGIAGDRVLLNVTYPNLRWLYKNALGLLHLTDDSWQPAGITTLVEAMATGCAVILGSGGLLEQEIRQYEVAWEYELPCLFVDKRDPANISQAIRCLEDSPEIVNTYRKLSYLFARRYWKHSNSKELFNEILGQFSKHRRSIT